MPEKLINLVKEHLRLFSAKDWVKYRAMMLPTVVYEEPATHRKVNGVDEMLNAIQLWTVAFPDLKGTVKTFLQELFGDLPIRFRASYFPFTEPSAEVDVQWKGRWLEVMGCGMVDPNVLKAVGLDPERYSGFAAGLGVERFAMVLHQIDDIRRLYSSDLRFLKQF